VAGLAGAGFAGGAPAGLAAARDLLAVALAGFADRPGDVDDFFIRSVLSLQPDDGFAGRVVASKAGERDMYESDYYTQFKVKIEVEIELLDGRIMLGHVFGAPKQRLSDLLNDDRQFVPFESSAGIVTVVRKSSIMRATPVQQTAQVDPEKDPYKILGVAQTISDEKLKEAYHQLGRQTHPDRLFALGLPKEFVDLANERMARVNDAYRRIAQQRGWGAARESASEDDLQPARRAASF
jgi:hypothetical protein